MFKFLKLFFEEPTEPSVDKVPAWDDVHDFGGIEFNDDGTMKIPAEKSADEKDVTKDEVEEEVEEEVDEEDDSTEGEDDGDADEEEDDDSTEDDDEDSTDTTIISKRLKDTQRAYHEGQKKIKELSERLEKLEKPAEKKDEQTEDVLTLENIDPKVLAASYAKDPVMTQRWVSDQQVKISLRQQDEARKQQDEANDRKTRIEKSEQVAVERFPVIKKILAMDEAAMEDFKKKSPEQYEFATKTVEYQKLFQDRGDEEALLNAASRAYAELSPKSLEKIKRDITKAVSKAQTDKQQATKKAAVGSGTGTKQKSKKSKVSESEFFKMDQHEQTDAMYADFESKLASLNSKKG